MDSVEVLRIKGVDAPPPLAETVAPPVESSPTQDLFRLYFPEKVQIYGKEIETKSIEDILSNHPVEASIEDYYRIALFLESKGIELKVESREGVTSPSELTRTTANDHLSGQMEGAALKIRHALEPHVIHALAPYLENGKTREEVVRSLTELSKRNDQMLNSGDKRKLERLCSLYTFVSSNSLFSKEDKREIAEALVSRYSTKKPVHEATFARLNMAMTVLSSEAQIESYSHKESLTEQEIEHVKEMMSRCKSASSSYYGSKLDFDALSTALKHCALAEGKNCGLYQAVVGDVRDVNELRELCELFLLYQGTIDRSELDSLALLLDAISMRSDELTTGQQEDEAYLNPLHLEDGASDLTYDMLPITFGSEIDLGIFDRYVSVVHDKHLRDHHSQSAHTHVPKNISESVLDQLSAGEQELVQGNLDGARKKSDKPQFVDVLSGVLAQAGFQEGKIQIETNPHSPIDVEWRFCWDASRDTLRALSAISEQL